VDLVEQLSRINVVKERENLNVALRSNHDPFAVELVGAPESVLPPLAEVHVANVELSLIFRLRLLVELVVDCDELPAVDLAPIFALESCQGHVAFVGRIERLGEVQGGFINKQTLLFLLFDKIKQFLIVLVERSLKHNLGAHITGHTLHVHVIIEGA
jgi:hypothetical protein